MARPGCPGPASWGLNPGFPRLSPCKGQVAYALLTRPPLPARRFCRSIPRGLLARLACVRHAASVHPEPGSNSYLNLSQGAASGARRASFGPLSLRFAFSFFSYPDSLLEFTGNSMLPVLPGSCISFLCSFFFPGRARLPGGAPRFLRYEVSNVPRPSPAPRWAASPAAPASLASFFILPHAPCFVNSFFQT